MRRIITAADGDMKVGDTTLPGVYQSCVVSGELRIDEKEVPGSSGTRKQPLGFEDAVITLQLLLPTDDNSDCYDKVKILTRLFKNVDGTAKPYVYRIVNKLLDAWQIREILFKALRTTDDNQKKDAIRADLEFVEYRPVLVNAEAKAASPPLKSKAVLPATQGRGDLLVSEANSAADFQLAASTNDYNDAGTRTAKNVPTPAVDDDPVILI